MIPLPTGTKIWLVAGTTDMRNGFNGLAAKVQTALKDDPLSTLRRTWATSAVCSRLMLTPGSTSYTGPAV